MYTATKMLRKLELLACVDYMNNGTPAFISKIEKIGEFMLVNIETNCEEKWNEIREKDFADATSD